QNWAGCCPCAVLSVLEKQPNINRLINRLKNCSKPSTTRLAVLFAVPPRFSIMTENTPESSTYTSLTTSVLLRLVETMRKSSEFWIAKFSRDHVTVGDGWPVNSHSNFADCLL